LLICWQRRFLSSVLSMVFGPFRSFFPICFIFRALNLSDPGSGFDTIVRVGSMNQNQAMTASICGTREPALVLHDE
jgi:hypothetical protein